MTNHFDAMRSFGKLSNYELRGQDILLDFEGRKARIEVITPSIINVFCGFQCEEHVSKAIEGDKRIQTKISTKPDGDRLWIYTDNISVCVSDGFYVDFYNMAGQAVCLDYRGEGEEKTQVSEESKRLLKAEGHIVEEEKQTAFSVRKKLQGSEHFYGLGDMTGFLDKRHYSYELWNTDNPMPQVDSFKSMYKTIPFFITLTDDHVYGIFLDNTWRSLFDMGCTSEEYYSFGAVGGNLDYYYFAGDSVAEILKQYMYMTGTCPLPQKWTLGYHQSRWGYITQEDVEAVAERMRICDVPCDAIHFDIDYMQDYKVFTWNMGRYHNDPSGFLKSLKERGFKAITIVDPGVKKESDYPIYEAGIEHNYFAKTPEGETYINRVWPGDVGFPDFGNPETREWWGNCHQFLLENGVQGIWNDMNEPASFNGPLPDEIVFTDEDRPVTHAEIHNAYGHLMAKATYEGLKRLSGKRPFVVGRACYAGSQKYTAVWTGDNHSMWAHLQMSIPQMCNLGLSGMAFVGPDIGGHSGDVTPELLTRWIQAGCFSPFFRNHNQKNRRLQEPWAFGENVLNIYRKYVKLRYQLIPYYYDIFWESEKSGLPVLRPLVLHYDKDEAAKVCNDEFMIGDQILVAPVVMQGMKRRMVYLPEGEWYDYWTKEKLTGPIWIMREAPIDTCPVYARSGSIIPMMEPQNYIGEKSLDTLILDVYPGEGSYNHFLDNGEDFSYREGEYNHYHFTVDKDGKVDLKLVHEGYDKPYKKIITYCLGKAGGDLLSE